MIAIASMGVLLAACLACVAIFAMRQRFMAHLDLLEKAIRTRSSVANPRSDLAPEVVALAARLGARTENGPSFVAFEQAGQMWRTPGGKPMDFTAQQTVGVGAPEFIWRARMGAMFPIVVADYFVAATGGLEVRLFGSIPVARMVGGAGANQAEALRYLAELPWNPDAILGNQTLDWTVVSPEKIKVATGVGAERGEVTFDLDERGLVTRVSAPSRLYAVKGGATTRPWHGRFWDYEYVEGRLIPAAG